MFPGYKINPATCCIAITFIYYFSTLLFTTTAEYNYTCQTYNDNKIASLTLIDSCKWHK